MGGDVRWRLPLAPDGLRGQNHRPEGDGASVWLSLLQAVVFRHAVTSSRVSPATTVK